MFVKFHENELWSCLPVWKLKPKWLSSSFSMFIGQCKRKKEAVSFRDRMTLFKSQLSIQYVCDLGKIT